MGYRKRERKDWIADDTWQAIEDRRDLKAKCNREPDWEKKEQWRQEYQQISRTVKKKTRRDKRRLVDNLACEAEVAARQRNMKDLYRITRQLAGKNRTSSRRGKTPEPGTPTAGTLEGAFPRTPEQTSSSNNTRDLHGANQNREDQLWEDLRG